MQPNTNTDPIIFYDGQCRLCQGIVKFVLQQDKRKKFKFASLQGSFARSLFKDEMTNNGEWNSFILLQNGTVYKKSSAALTLFTQLGWKWQWMYLGWLLPTFTRDALYDFVARNRYKWFGKDESCLLPKKEWEDRFIDE